MKELIAFVVFTITLAFLEIKGFYHPVLWFICGLWAVATRFNHEETK